MGSCAHSQGRGVAVRRSALAGALAGLVLVSGCAVGGGAADGGTGQAQNHAPTRDLAQKAEALPESQVRRPALEAEDRPHEKERWPGRKAQASGILEIERSPRDKQDSSGKPPAGPSPKALAAIDDQRGDQGIGPGYADLRRVDLADDGSALSVQVSVDSAIPGTLDVHEVAGVGIDLFRSSSQESDYQVFLDGGHDGWRAYLQTPDGFVRFPGYFAFDEKTFYVTVPWKSLGGRRTGEVSVFADWSAAAGRSSSDSTSRVGLPGD